MAFALAAIWGQIQDHSFDDADKNDRFGSQMHEKKVRCGERIRVMLDLDYIEREPQVLVSIQNTHSITGFLRRRASTACRDVQDPE